MHADVSGFVLGADRLQPPRDLLVVEARAADRVHLQQLRAHQRAAEVVRHQAPDTAGLEHVAPHPFQVRGRAAKIGGDDVAAGESLLDDLDEARVRREQRGDGGAVHPGDEEHLVGDLLQGLEEGGVEYVPIALHQRHQHAVRAAEGLLVAREHLHVFVFEGHHLAETGVHAQPRGGQAEQHRNDGEQHEQGAAPRK